MSSPASSIREIKKLNELQNRDQWVNNIHPLVKLLCTLFFIAVLVSYGKYQIVSILVMSIYPLFVFYMGDLSIKAGIYRMRFIIPIVAIVGILNPFFDREVIVTAFGIGISGGVISFFSLMLKGILSVMASYLLIATTSIEDICFALKMLHLPNVLVTIILLIDRYIYVLLDEAVRIMNAYKLRAPNQKGIHYKAWGSLVGQMLIRSMDRAENIYESMCLRGYNGTFEYSKGKKMDAGSIIYGVIWICIFVVFRFTNVIELIGGLFI